MLADFLERLRGALAERGKHRALRPHLLQVGRDGFVAGLRAFFRGVEQRLERLLALVDFLRDRFVDHPRVDAPLDAWCHPGDFLAVRIGEQKNFLAGR